MEAVMAVAQSTYPLIHPIGQVGQIINGETSNRISRTVETVAGIAFGQPTFRGANDHGCVAGGTFAATGAGSAAPTGNVGTGVITASPAVAAPAAQGRYRAVLIGTGATAPFLLYNPDGVVVGDGVVATPATIDGIGPFTISNAGTMTAGDTYYIDVTYTANATFHGLAVLDHVVPPNATTPDVYPRYYTANIMTEGEMIVTAGGTVTPGLRVYWDPATSRYSADSTKIAIPSCRFDTSAVNGGLVKIGLKTRS
jgi:hypothetical protein